MLLLAKQHQSFNLHRFRYGTKFYFQKKKYLNQPDLPDLLFSADIIKLDEYAPNRLAYHYHSASQGLAVFSEVYYPKGWNAYVDGKVVPHFRANYVLRAMVLPAGDHKLLFKFEPTVYVTGEIISLISSLILIAFILIMAAREFMKVRKSRA